MSECALFALSIRSKGGMAAVPPLVAVASGMDGGLKGGRGVTYCITVTAGKVVI